jgi:hypothetical protein
LRSEKKVDRVVLELFLELLKRGSYVRGSQLRKELIKRGVITSSDSDRKVVDRALSRLEEWGLVDSQGGVGRRGKRWKINSKVFALINPLSSEEELNLLIFLALIPEDYKKLHLFDPIKKLVERVLQTTDPETERLISDSFSYEPFFSQRYSPVKVDTFRQVVQAILKGCKVRLLRRDRFKHELQTRTVYPINLFFYEGNFYLGVLKENGDFRSYLLSTVKVMEVREREKIPDHLKGKAEEVRRYRMNLIEGDPFLFGVKLGYDGFDLEIEGASIFATQFGSRRLEDGYAVYLVGYNGPRFYRHFLLRDFVEIIPPDEQLVALAKRSKVRQLLSEKFPYLPLPSFSLEENKKNFEKFLSELNSYLEKRVEAVKKLK